MRQVELIGEQLRMAEESGALSPAHHAALAAQNAETRTKIATQLAVATARVAHLRQIVASLYGDAPHRS